MGIRANYLKLAAIWLATIIVTVQLVVVAGQVVEETSPPQPSKAWPDAAVAVRVTEEPYR